MTLVDDRGRVGGRVNLVDAFAALVIIVLIPVAFGAYLLFRAPRPKLLSVSPTKLYQGHNLKVEIEGTDLRPFMRVSFNTNRARSFLLGSTKYALIDLPDLSPGTYDVVLYDYAQEVGRLPKALTVVASATDVELEVVGAFKSVPDAVFTRLKTGARFPSADNAMAEIVSVGGPAPSELRLRAGEGTVVVPLNGEHDVPATLRLKCYTARSQDGSARCMVPGPDEPAVVAPDALLPLALPPGWVSFQITSVHPTNAPSVVAARIRFVVAPELVTKVRAGDRDTGAKGLELAHSAIITGVAAPRPLTSGEAVGRLSPVGGPLTVLDATVDVPVDPGASGWTYKNQPFKAGVPFTFETAQYVIQGALISVLPQAASPDSPVSR